MKEKILEILKEIDADKDYESSDALVTDGLLASLDIIQLIDYFDDAFDIEIPAVQIVPANFNSVDSMAAMVQRLQDED